MCKKNDKYQVWYNITNYTKHSNINTKLCNQIKALKSKAKARELDNQIKEKELVWLQHLEKNAADVPDLVDAGKKEQEEFVNTDDTETTDDGFARADGLMMDPLDILNQCVVILDQKELEDAKARKLELEKVRAMQKNKKMGKIRRGKH